MKRLRKIIALALAFAVAFSSVNYVAPSAEVLADAVSAEQWTNTAIVSPANGSLIGAGYIDVKWNNELEGVSTYSVYVDNALVATVAPTADKVMAAEFYTTTVSAHTAYVSATMVSGAIVNSPVSTFYVTKKGICVNEDMGQNLDAASLNIGWYYNWGTTPFDSKFSNRTFDNMDYTPMVWGQQTIKEVAFENAKANGNKYILGYNEPDLGNQANMDVDKVINRWGDFMNTGLRLGSPATATAPCWSDKWFKPFMERINVMSSLDVDIIAVHCYWGTDLETNKAALQFLEAMDEVYSLYHKPIWITEFAVGEQHKSLSMADPTTAKQVENFLKIVLEGLEARSYIERYSWFSFDPEDYSSATDGASGLWNRKTGELTNLGKIYAEIGNPAGYPAKIYGAYTPTGVNVSPAACAAAVKATLYTATGNSTKRTIKVNIKAINNAKGYQVRYSTKKTMKKSKVKNTTKTTLTLKKLKRGKKYYVQVRGYYLMDGKKLYTSWSAKKSVKIKKLKKTKKTKKSKKK